MSVWTALSWLVHNKCENKVVKPKPEILFPHGHTGKHTGQIHQQLRNPGKCSQGGLAGTNWVSSRHGQLPLNLPPFQPSTDTETFTCPYLWQNKWGVIFILQAGLLTSMAFMQKEMHSRTRTNINREVWSAFKKSSPTEVLWDAQGL